MSKSDGKMPGKVEVKEEIKEEVCTLFTVVSLPLHWLHNMGCFVVNRCFVCVKFNKRPSAAVSRLKKKFDSRKPGAKKM